jgi:Zn-dependent protease
MEFSPDLIEILISVLAFLPAIVLHELAHGYIAYRLGDSTAKRQGRLTLNPLKHLDVLGTLAVLIVGFGWAKPVPVNPNNFANRRRDLMLTSLAGPLTNLILALIGGIILSILQGKLEETSFLITYLATFVLINTLLMVLNLIPLKPLDGEDVVNYLLPRRWRLGWNEFQEHGPVILISLIAIQIIFNFPVIGYLIRIPSFWLADIITQLLGINNFWLLV